MTKQELIDAANNIEKKYIANNAWKAIDSNGGICKCIFGEILESIGSTAKVGAGESSTMNCWIIGRELGIDWGKIERIIYRYDGIASNRKANFSKVLPSQKAKEAFVEAVNFIWEDVEDD